MSAPYQCNVIIVNHTRQSFSRSSYFPKDVWSKGHGEYSTKPPQSISPGETVNFCLEKYPPRDHPIGNGPEGGCEYTSQDGSTGLSLSYQCPTYDNNSADAMIVKGRLWVQMIPNPLPIAGEPLNVQFNIFDI